MQILIHRDGKEFGPYTLEQAREYLASGDLRANDLAWHEGVADWLPLSQVEGMSAPLAVNAPASSAPAAAPAQPPPPARSAAPSVSPLTRSLRSVAMRNMGIGGLWFTGGSAVTFFSYEAATSGTGGGSYFMAWGAIIFGGIQFVRGLIQYFKA